MLLNNQKRLRELSKANKKEIVSRFLWVPLMIDGDLRWLQKVTVKRMVWIRPSLFGVKYIWVYIEWL